MDRDLEDDIRADAEIMQKLQDTGYARDVYAALCNIRWQPKEVWPVLQDEWWTCSWRCAGGIVADLRLQDEDYMDFYCAGKEGTVTDEIAEDFSRIGWRWSEWPKDKLDQL